MLAFPNLPGALTGGATPLHENVGALLAAAAAFAPDARRWLEAYGALLDGRPAAAIRTLHRAGSESSTSDLVRLEALARGRGRDPRGGLRLLAAGFEDGSAAPADRAVAALLEAQRSRLEPANEHVDALQSATPDDPVVYYLRALLNASADDWIPAIVSASRAAALAPGWLEARLTLGYFMIRAEQTNPALTVLQTTASAWPDDFQARYRLGSLYKLLADQLRFRLTALAESARPEQVPVALWRRRVTANEVLAKRIAELAAAEYAYARVRRPGDVRTRWQLADVLRTAGRPAEAHVLFSRLGEQDPAQWIYPFRRGALDLAAGDSEAAIDRLRHALRLRPDQADVLAVLGLALLDRGDADEAQRTLERATVFEPFNPAVHHNLGVARAALGDLDGAEHAWRRGLELRTFPLPRTHLTHTNLALLHHRRGDEAAARRAHRARIVRVPGLRAGDGGACRDRRTRALLGRVCRE